MTRRASIAASLLLLASTVPSYAGFFLPINTTLIIPTGDAFFSASGTDSAGNVIGTDCILAAPCQTPAKALSFQAANVASNPARNLKFYFLDSGGMYFLPSTLVYNSHHTVSSGFTSSWLNYPAQHPIFSGGKDAQGTWSAATPIPNGSGTNGCVSNALASSAPLVDGTTTTTAGLYVGAAWFNGQWTAETIRPTIGSTPDSIPGTPGTIPTQAQIPQGPTASFTSGSTSVGISDLSKIGIVGQTVMFDTTQDGFTAFFDYFILSKSAATGSGTVTLSATGPTGSAFSATGTASSIQVSDATQSLSHGTRTNTHGVNQFPVNSGFQTSTNVGDEKIWLSVVGESTSLVPLAAATSSQVTMASRWWAYSTMYSGVLVRRWNRFEDLGTGGNVGELYTNRTTGNIYYTPRVGETCSSINAPGYVIIPTSLEILLKISSATADGSASNIPVGNFVVNGIAFEHANTSILSGLHSLSGMVGGVIGGAGQSGFSQQDSAITMIGASNVTLQNVTVAHVASSAIAVAWGSNHVTIDHSTITDVGGNGILSGMSTPAGDNYHYLSDPGYYGTAAMGPSTPSWNNGGLAANKDQTGAHDCCQTITNNFITDVGKVYNGSACLATTGWQNFTIQHNQMLYCPEGGIQEDSIAMTTTASPSFGGPNAQYGGVLVPVSFGNDVSFNEVGFVGYETSITNAHIPGSNELNDFGALYIRAGHDGLGDGSATGTPTNVHDNWVHDVSGGCDANVKSTNGAVVPHTINAVLSYFDQATYGINLYNNVFSNAATVGGRVQCPTDISQRTGAFRTTVHNNIWVATYPAGWTQPNDYVVRADLGPFPLFPQRSMAYTCASGTPCYVVNLGRLYQATVSGTTGAGATAPTCTSGVCSADGTMTWSFLQNLPGNSFSTETNNIVAWTVAGGGGSTGDFPEGSQWNVFFPQFTQTDSNIYWESGHTMTFYNHQGSTTPFSTWVGLGQDTTTNSLGGFNCNPNFPDITGASGLSGFQPNPTSCPGLGYSWPGFSTLGPQ